jgi:hypothetical protein
MVWGQWAGFFESYGQIFTLGPTRSWQGGAADCTAELVNRDDYKYRILARTSFRVSG